jgi:hypothetical protein
MRKSSASNNRTELGILKYDGANLNFDSTFSIPVHSDRFTGRYISPYGSLSLISALLNPNCCVHIVL